MAYVNRELGTMLDTGSEASESPELVGYSCGLFNRTFAVYSSLVSFFIPLSIMIFADIRSIQILRRSMKLPGRTSSSASSNPTPENIRLEASRNPRDTPAQDERLLRSTPTGIKDCLNEILADYDSDIRQVSSLRSGDTRGFDEPNDGEFERSRCLTSSSSNRFNYESRSGPDARFSNQYSNMNTSRERDIDVRFSAQYSNLNTSRERDMDEYFSDMSVSSSSVSRGITPSWNRSPSEHINNCITDQSNSDRNGLSVFQRMSIKKEPSAISRIRRSYYEPNNSNNSPGGRYGTYALRTGFLFDENGKGENSTPQKIEHRSSRASHESQRSPGIKFTGKGRSRGRFSRNPQMSLSGSRNCKSSVIYFSMLASGGGECVKINSRERRAERTLIWVFVAFVVLWLPFFCANLAYGLCDSCNIPSDVFMVFTWLGYFSSGVNPCIYTYLNKDFRNAFRNILACRRIHSRGARIPRQYS